MLFAKIGLTLTSPSHVRENDMKAKNIIDAAIENSNNAMIVEMPNGSQVSITGFRYGSNKRGEPVLVLVAGRETGK